MEPSEIKELKQGAPVWVWLSGWVRAVGGPGTVERIETRYGLPLVRSV